jgi:hypothetical protein
LLSYFADIVAPDRVKQYKRKYNYAALRIRIKTAFVIHVYYLAMFKRFIVHQNLACGVIRFTVAAKLYLRFAAQSRHRFADKATHQIGQLHQVGEPQKRLSIAHDDFRIRAHKISPLRGDRPNCGIIGLQQKAFAIAVVSPVDTWQLPCEQRMKRMRDPH